MRREDMQTLAVLLFEQGMAPSRIDEALRCTVGFAHDAVVLWWQLMNWRNTW